MRRLVIPALCLIAAPPLLAQKATEAATQSVATYRSLVAEFDAATKTYRGLVQKLSKTEAYQALLKDRDTKGLAKLRDAVPAVDVESFLLRFDAGAAAYASDEAAVPYLNWIALNASKRVACRAAVNTLLENHLESEGLLALAENMPRIAARLGQERSRDVYDTLINGNPHDLVQANALYSLAMGTMRGQSADEAAKAEAIDLLDEAALLAEGTELALRAGAYRFEQDRLQIGKVAPDIIAADLDGVEFKLSDYRGKVVVLDFWGDW